MASMPSSSVARRLAASSRNEEAELKRWVEAFADEPVKWYCEKHTGKTMDRPAWNRLENDMVAGKISKVVVWRIDRLGRTAAGFTKLFEDFQRLKIGFESIRDKIDLSTPAGRLIANVLASVAAYENEVRSARIIAGQNAARNAGKTWGGSKKKGRRLSVTDEQIRTIQRMAKEGESKAAMARATKLSRPTVYAILSDNS